MFEKQLKENTSGRCYGVTMKLGYAVVRVNLVEFCHGKMVTA